MTNSKRSDLEAQAKDEKRGKSGSPTPRLDSEYRVPAARKFAFLGVYFLCNVSLTIYNKAVLGKVFSSFLASPILFHQLQTRPINTGLTKGSSHTRGSSLPSTPAPLQLDAISFW